MEKNIKILFIHHAAGWGGAPINMLNIINSLDKSKYQVHVLLIKDSIVSDKLKKNNISYSIAQSKFYKKYYQYFTHSEAEYVKFYQIFKFIRLSLIWLLSRYFFSKRELKNFEFDIIHLNSSVLTDWLAPTAKLGKVIVHVQEPFRKGKFDLLHYFFRLQYKKYADHILAISHDNARRINIPEKTTVIYNFAKLPGIAPKLDSYRSKRFLYVGGAAYIKGFYTMVDALDYLDDEIIIIFAGDYSSPYRQKTFRTTVKKALGKGRKKQLAIQRMKKHKNAVEVGLVTDIGPLLQECCCLISPFTVPHFSRPVIESFLYQKPVIVSDVDGMQEIVDSNLNGFVFQKGNPKELAELINILAKHPERCIKMGKNGYEKAILSFTNRNVDQILNVYQKIFK